MSCAEVKGGLVTINDKAIFNPSKAMLKKLRAEKTPFSKTLLGVVGVIGKVTFIYDRINMIEITIPLADNNMKFCLPYGEVSLT